MTDWFTDRHLFLLATVVYGASMIYAVFLWRKGFREDNRVNYFLLLAAFLLHTAAMLKRGFSFNSCPINTLYGATIFFVWTIVAAYLVIGLWSRLRFLGAFASPILFAVSVFALLTPEEIQQRATFDYSNGGLTLHIALFVLAYAAFGLSCIAALMYLSQERNLKLHKMRAVFSLMPPIQRLELIAARTLMAGFALLTFALLASIAFVHQQEPAVSPRGDFKVLWSLFVWALYLGLILMRWKVWHGGRRFALGSVGAFAFVLLTFWGSSLLSPLHRP